MCDKQQFSKVAAQAAITKAAKSRKRYRNEKRKYYCHDCNCWHLTSRDYIPKAEDIKLNFFKQWIKLLTT